MCRDELDKLWLLYLFCSRHAKRGEEEDGASTGYTEYTHGRQTPINGRFVFVFDQLIAETSEGGIPLSTIARLKKCCGRDKERGRNEWIGEFCGMCLTSGALVHSEMIAGFIGSEGTRVICGCFRSESQRLLVYLFLCSIT
ncbi:uncharacterized protein AKAW2_10569A [Aspergillus luchuensis]|uniref:Uncharacterized protein n=1 Tax=Aspergillus kawachii TaxID=1069201 RepID=A0A7R7VZC1_ASPKA|nr:uncharacterized protein AKAW2_10569A [Aspergillus luchuensis]BCR93523.1 hypothetical protein AKAW2_10569A [Aspergillus luchuensis]